MYDRIITGMQATGIPPHLAISKQMKDMSERIDLLEESIRKHHSDLVDTLPLAVAEKV
jgi:hypothetical protein